MPGRRPHGPAPRPAGPGALDPEAARLAAEPTAEPAQTGPADRGLTVVGHPLVQNSLVALRSVDTATESFRRHARLVAQVLALRVLEDLPTRPVTVTTPIQVTGGSVLDRSVIFVPVLRAGLALLDAMSDFVPGSKVGFVGLERDETTAIARSYYQKLPEQLTDAEVIILDPMLATGGSALATIGLLQEHRARAIRLVAVVAAPEGIAAVRGRHPGVRIFTAVVDSHLNERKYIVPGLGDFGDRYFGTT